VPGDVSDREAVEQPIAKVTRHYGAVDVLVNNAGIIQVGPVQTMSVEDYHRALDVMFWGVVYPTLAVLPQMRARRRGRIVNITSIGGLVSVPHLLPYNCAKFAAVGFSEGLRAELARESISVTTIVPGLMRTGSAVNALMKGRREQEFTWFSLGASLPLVSMDAERAARQIVRAAKRGEAERILSIPAALLARFHGLFPGLTTNLLGLVNRVLPRPGAETPGSAPSTAERGMDVQRRVRSPLFHFATTWGRKAARRFHQYPGPSSTATEAQSAPGQTAQTPEPHG
jgi:short-subunit dehydrogenase